MFELLARAGAVVLENAHIFETRITFEILYSLCSQHQELFNLTITGIPELAVVTRILDQHLMRAYRPHPVIKTITAAGGIAFDAVQRCRVHNRTRRPGITFQPWSTGYDLVRSGRVRAEPAFRF